MGKGIIRGSELRYEVLSSSFGDTWAVSAEEKKRKKGYIYYR